MQRRTCWAAKVPPPSPLALSPRRLASRRPACSRFLDALLDRWLNKEQERYRTLLPANADAKARLLTHISATQQETSEAGIRTLTLLAAQAGTQSESMVNWYKERFGNLEASDEASRKRRILYLATEGAFMMRNMVGFESESAFWDEVFNDLKEFAE